MSASSQPLPSTSAALYYLYVGSEWSGPFHSQQVRFFHQHGQVESDTYAYDPDQQRHYTVGELLALLDSAPTTGEDEHPLVPSDLDEASIPSATRIFANHEDESEATATLGTSLDALPELLRSFWRTYIDLTEGQPSDREQQLAHLREIGSVIGIQFSAAQGDADTLTLLTGDLLRLADYLANRHQDDAFWEAIEVLRQHRPESDGEEVVNSARLVVSCIIERAKQGLASRVSSGLVPTKRDAARDVSPVMNDSQELRIPTDTWEQPHAHTARLILRDARKELRSTEADLDAIQKAYAELQETHTRDLDEARELLANLESARADEQSNAAQALAEVRSLAAEIHRLAEENLASEVDLKQEITRLAEELRGSDATAMAPLAEALLIRLVTRLRNLAAEGVGAALPAEVLALREELARVRSEHVQARAQVVLLTDERDRLKRLLDEQRAAAERAIANSKEREQRLRSTVTALEVTKNLHQDVMRELDVQLQSAQRRVTDMEAELSTVRVELKSTRITLADRTKELQDEMRRAIELRAMLEARREELSANLKTAEAELSQAQSDQSSPGSFSDPQMMEALAAKVTHVRTMFEATKRRLDEQQITTAKLEDELALSRREASELRGRGDSLTSELHEARAGLSAAKKRFEELNRAYTRLESERESLQAELVNRKGTDTLRGPTEKTEKGTDPAETHSGTAKLSRVMEQLEQKLGETTRRLEQANDQLEAERRRVTEFGEHQQQLQLRVEDLTADRDHLRTELDKLHIEHFTEHSRNSASVAVSTQATIEAERRFKEAMARVVELEEQVAYLQENQASPGAALSELSAENNDIVSGELVLPAQIAELRARLADAQAEVERLKPVTNGSASGQRHALTVRVAQVESELAAAVAARDESSIQLRSLIAERDRLSRDYARLKNEQESAAVEHRVALKSARDKFTESQARVQVLEQELDRARIADGNQTITVDKLSDERDQLKAERDRLSDEVRELRLAIDKAAVIEDLPKIRVQLDQELDRIRALTRSLADAQTQADAARARVQELEVYAAGAQHERDILQIEIERVKGELLMAQATVGAARDTDHDRRSRVEARMQEVLNDREQLLDELSRVNAELMQVRGRLVRAESQTIVADRLPFEQARLRELEAQVAQQRAEQAAANASLSEVRSQLTAVTAERDRLRGEVERLRAQIASAPGGGVVIPELMALRDKLTRAKARIRALRKERDDLLALTGMPLSAGEATGSRQTLTGETHGFTSRIERSDSAGARHDNAGSSMLSAAAHASIPGTAALMRRTSDDSAPGGAIGFTSAIGRPQITQPAANPVAMTATIVRSDTTVSASPARPRRMLVPVLLMMVGCTATVALGGAWLMSLAPVASRAVVNARVTTMAAPIDGRVEPLPVRAGDVVSAGSVVVTVVNDLPDRAALDALQVQVDEADTQAQVAAGEAAAAAQVLADAKLRREALRTALIAELEDQQQRVVAMLDTRRAEAARLTVAAETPTADEASKRSAISAVRALAQAEAAAARDIRLLATLHSGVVPADVPGANELQIAETAATLAQARQEQLSAALLALKQQLVDESALVASRSQATLTAVVAGPVWRVHASAGAWVARGDTILSLCDGGSLIVAAVIPKAHADAVHVGDQALISLAGGHQPLFGTVQAIDQPPVGKQAVDLGALDGVPIEIAFAPEVNGDALVVGTAVQVLVTPADAGPLLRLSVRLHQLWH